MEKKIVLSLLILLQAIGSLSETNSITSQDHVRKKRIIDTTPNRNETFLNQTVRYVVLILKENGEVLCTGSILSSRIIITAAHCVMHNKCFVESGGRRSRISKNHSILIKHVYEDFNYNVKSKDLALLVLKEPIDILTYHKPIEFYEGHLPPNSQGIVTGWGSIHKGYLCQYPLQPQSIKVEITTLQQCQFAYRSDQSIIITSHNLCIYHSNRTKHCWYGDSGGPLVVNGRLVGVFSWFELTGASEYPDVFSNLLHPDYKLWVHNWFKHFHEHYPN